MDLHGSCSCGRNNYVIEIPSTSKHLAQVYFDNSNVNRRHLASPFTAWLRVPLDWFYSATFAFFTDEVHTSIRRTFISPYDSRSRRQFCGYCGTHLTLWREDDEFIDITLGSLFDEDLEGMEDAGLLSLGGDEAGEEEEDEGEMADKGEEEEQEEVGQMRKASSSARPVSHRGAPWFESMVEDSRLGKLQRQKGGHSSEDGSVKYEWEIVEWTADDDDGDDASGSSGKRKADDLEEDARMQT
ncbi:hypothetical protein EJ08DRAFT_645769 [Tothia fuscella]|uniref:CENP-V/GFA domain-containing protein n=1 Tax=Tothia fuscella TaxID=1048955 RepID=A0A9P4NZP1_9PEZI|nr:hypothetical protein EJ08DRAFT_645769 [Tothia fuscella]